MRYTGENLALVGWGWTSLHFADIASIRLKIEPRRENNLQVGPPEAQRN